MTYNYIILSNNILQLKTRKVIDECIELYITKSIHGVITDEYTV